MEELNASNDAMNTIRNGSDNENNGDNGRALEVQALYEGTPRAVKHYRSTRGGRITTVTGVLLFCGLVLSVGGIAAFGTQLVSVHRQEVQRAKVRDFVKERGLPEHFVPAVRSNRASELGGAVAFAGGLFLLLFGLFRARDERKVVAFTIGEDPCADYATPVEGLPGAKFPLVAARDDGFVMSFTSAMEGSVTLPGGDGQGRCDAVTLYDLAHSGEARPAATPGVFEYRVADGVRCRLDLGASTFLINSVDAGEDPEKQDAGAVLAAGVRRPIALTTASSAAVVLAFLMLFHLKPAEAGAMEADGLSQSNNRRIRSLLKQARKESEPGAQPQDETKKPPQARRDPTSKAQANRTTRDDRHTRRNRSGDQGHTASNPANRSRNQGSNVGVVAVLTNMRHKMSRMLSYHSTMMTEAEDALTALQPNQGPGGDDSWLPSSRSPGPDGPGIVGPPGNCKGGKCNGNPWIDNSNPWTVTAPSFIPTPTRDYRTTDPVVPQAIEHVEGIGASTIRRYMRMKRSQFRYCYVNHAMASNSRAAGTVKVSFIISKKGLVLKVRVTFSTLNHGATEQCLVRAIKRIKFPKTGGQTAFVTYPIRFRAVGRR